MVSVVDTDADLPFLRPGDPLWLTWDQDAPFALEGWPAHAGATTTDVDHVEATLEGISSTVAAGSPVAAAPSSSGVGRPASSEVRW